MRVTELNDAHELGAGIGFKLVELVEERLQGPGILDAKFGAGEGAYDACSDGFAATNSSERGWANGGGCDVSRRPGPGRSGPGRTRRVCNRSRRGSFGV